MTERELSDEVISVVLSTAVAVSISVENEEMLTVGDTLEVKLVDITKFAEVVTSVALTTSAVVSKTAEGNITIEIMLVVDGTRSVLVVVSLEGVGESVCSAMTSVSLMLVEE